MAANDSEKPPVGTAVEPAAAPGGQRMRFNTANLKSGYANVVTATTTREEVVLSFGINNSWEHPSAEVEIELTHRIILSPMAAERLLATLSRVMSDYRTRYGALTHAVTAEGPTTPQ